MASAFPAWQDGTSLASQIQPAALTAPVLREAPLYIPNDTGVRLLSRVRITGRMLLTVLSWPGDHAVAIRVLHCLVENAIKHGLSFGQTGQNLRVCLRVTEAHEFLIDVTDPNPRFPGFGKAIAESPGRSLEVIARVGELSWSVTPQADAKTVRAVIRPGVTDP